MVSSVGSFNVPLTPQPPRRGQGADAYNAQRPQQPVSTQDKPDQQSSSRRQPISLQPARQAIDERTGKASDLQVFRADEVPLKSVRALQAYGEVASNGSSNSGESQLAGVNIHV